MEGYSSTRMEKFLEASLEAHSGRFLSTSSEKGYSDSDFQHPHEKYVRKV